MKPVEGETRRKPNNPSLVEGTFYVVRGDEKDHVSKGDAREHSKEQGPFVPQKVTQFTACFDRFVSASDYLAPSAHH
ncbi:hypothetical protein KIPB_007303 [Kipferlia bialata]|uniref:Uncharacterized protein n=1 Tax=Kipferlia bialata TaxID=797122 RepID=A0A9K3GKH1_9EUKA|nr:hypothetical protein KIPB_007303 [Kipferlia bialata]|eukprot:g7303.t1